MLHLGATWTEASGRRNKPQQPRDLHNTLTGQQVVVTSLIFANIQGLESYTYNKIPSESIALTEGNCVCRLDGDPLNIVRTVG